MFKIDLHTHSEASPDGGISFEQYEQILSDGTLNCVAITDHNSIDFAIGAHQRLGNKVIIGEEIMTTEGEIIGLFLRDTVLPGQTPEDTVRAIKSQGGLVYIPHPFETFRKGLHPQVIEALGAEVDIIEVCNGRAFVQNRSKQAVVWARINNIPGAASSDAHGVRGLGSTYTDIEAMPNKETLAELIKKGQLTTSRPNMRTLLYPKYHRTRKKLKGMHS